MVYRERPAAVPGAVLWQREATAGSVTRILPDGCLDLIWDGSSLVVAGPDTRARMHGPSAPCRYTALRLSAGLGPALLGIPGSEVRDRSPALADLWPAGRARALSEQVADDPAGALEAWLLAEVESRGLDPQGFRVLALARSGTSAGGIAEAVGLAPRQLHRRCLVLFGYGPQHLLRVVRLERALTMARAGVPLACVAAECGYADQAHLSRDVRELAGLPPARLLASGG